MKNRKTVLATVLALVLAFTSALSFSSCGESKKVYTVGICQQATHDALDAATRGFQDALKDKLGADNVVFDLKNAAGDSNICNTIVNSFVSKKVDLIMANATAALQAAYNATSTIPILGTSVTEYGGALNLKDFNGTVGGNVSGTSDLAPLTEQGDMLMELFPEAKKVGILYCSAESNSEYQVKVMEEYLGGKGLTCTRYAFSDTNDVVSVTTRALPTAMSSISRQTTRRRPARRQSAALSGRRRCLLSRANPAFASVAVWRLFPSATMISAIRPARWLPKF